MAITPSDFSKIWASNADTPEYTFSEANYLKGWDFVGNLPPTRAQWNAIQKSTDEKMKYVFDNFGAPLTASTVAEMTMQNRVYVYTGSETGYTAGHWYYWNGSAWTDGGVYNSNTVQVDNTLTVSGAAADAKVVGNKFALTIPLNYNSATTIPSGSDIDNYTTPGTYRVNTLSDAGNIANLPAVTSGRLIVMSLIASTIIQQIYIEALVKNRIWIRLKKGSTSPFEDWNELATDTLIKERESILRSIINDSNDNSIKSNGHLYEIFAPGFETINALELEDDDTITETTTKLLFSDYVKCPKHLYVVIPSDVYCRIYFYTKNGSTYSLRQDVINYRPSASNKRYNQLSLAWYKNRVIDIPDNTYMRVYNGDAIRMFGWDGVPFGCHLSADLSVPQAPTSEGHLINDPASGITVPGNAKAIFANNSILYLVYGVKSDGTKEKVFPIDDGYFSVMSCILPEGYEYFRVRISCGSRFIDNNSATVISDNKCYSGDVSAFISCLCDVDTVESQGIANVIRKRAEIINNVAWTPVADVQATSSETTVYRAGLQYNGIPYAAHWDSCEFVGWFVSKHTFINAVNDENSIFYKEHDLYGRPGYGTVCSAFATLASGYPYPLANYDMREHPDVHRIKRNQPEFGAIMGDLTDHCLIPIAMEHNEAWDSVMTAESIIPVSTETMRYTFIPTTDDVVTYWNDNNYDHLYPYVWAITHKDGVYPFPYNMEKGTITNGSARPYRGDRSVYTSDMDIRINIKNNTATMLYYEPFSYDPDTDTFTSIGEAQNIAINGATYIDIPTETLTDGTIYGVYTDANIIVEYFEYREVKQVTYHLTDDNIEFGNNAGEFWYCRCPNRFPYKTDGDYSVYRSAFNSWSINCTIFYKGIFGGYKMPLKKV